MHASKIIALQILFGREIIKIIVRLLFQIAQFLPNEDNM